MPFSIHYPFVPTKKQLMVCAGTACATAFIGISLPARDKSFSFHLDSLFANLSFSCWNVLCFDLPTNDGNPRYFSCCLIISAPNICFMPSYVSIGVFRLKNNEVFSLLSCWPVEDSYTCRSRISSPHSLGVAWQKSRLSSVKNMCDICGPL